MRLHDAAVYFDRESIYDGYTNALLFKGQTSNFDDATSVGATLRRRTLSLAPALAVPTRRCVRVGDLRWLAGLGIKDSFQGADIRNTYNLRVATDLFSIFSPLEVMVPPVTPDTAYGYAEYFKSTVDTKDDSEYDNFWNIFFAPDEPVSQGAFLRVDGRCLRVRQTYVAPEDLRIAQCDELDSDWDQTVTFHGLGVYDPLTEQTSGGDVAVKGILFDLTKFYRWRNLAESAVQPGDRVLMVPTTVTPKPNSMLTVAGSEWRVLSIQPELDAWAAHIRPA